MTDGRTSRARSCDEAGRLNTRVSAPASDTPIDETLINETIPPQPP